jgi:hypothetical protein
MGLLGRGLPYRFFKAIERYQYSVANVIGVQTPANLPYFDAWSGGAGRRVEVLQNWLADAQCHVGVVALDPRHKTHNIPGKFLSYMQSGLPVLATINAGNDLADLIQAERVGRVCTDDAVDTLQRLAQDLAGELAGDTTMSARCRALSAKLFSPEAVVKQITAALANTVDATLDRHGLRPRDDEATAAINNVAACAGTAGARGVKGL